MFTVTCTMLCLGGVFGLGLYTGAEHTQWYVAATDAWKDLLQTLGMMSGDLRTKAGVFPEFLVQPSRRSGDGVTINELPADNDDLVFISGFYGESLELRLVRRDGTVVNRIPVSFSKLFKGADYLSDTPQTDWNVDLHGALALPDGSVVFNFEYSGLAKVDRCGKLVWRLKRRTHHSVERASGGGFWVPDRREVPKGGKAPFPPFIPPYEEDFVLKVSDDGEILEELSVPAMFYDSNLESLLTSTGSSLDVTKTWDQEILHLNKVTELPSELAPAFPQFAPGDLLMSLRDYNLVFVVDGTSKRIKWWSIGPWVRQHDPEFTSDGHIQVFNNNITGIAFGKDWGVSHLGIPRVSNVLDMDVASHRTHVVYGGAGQEMLSVIRGKIDLTDDGGVLVTEFEGGRVFQVDASGKIVWEYIQRYDDDWVCELSEARLYPARYFHVEDWTCPK